MTAPTTKALCGAKRRSGDPCKRPSGWGTDHLGVGRCKLHGGSTPSHIAAAAPAMQARAAMKFGLRVETTPIAALLDALWLAAGYQEWLHFQLGDHPGEDDQARIAEWRDAVDRQAAIASTCLQRGVEIAVVNAHQRVAEVLVGLLDRILPRLGVALSDDVIELVATELRAGGFGSST